VLISNAIIQVLVFIRPPGSFDSSRRLQPIRRWSGVGERTLPRGETA